jgi:photosystem II stability/assembly factor-like uncharacterized protein
MKLKHSVASFICFLILIGIVGIGCSDKEETVGSSNPMVNEQDIQGETASDVVEPSEVPKPSVVPVAEPGTEPTAIPVSEAASPWKLVSETTVDTAVFYAGFLNESIGVTVGYAGATSYTEDGGKNWSQSSNVSACRYGLDILDESFIVDSGNSGVNLISHDKGKSWSNLGDFPLKSSSAYNKFLSVLDKNNIYIGSSKSLGVSEDGGLTWKELALPEECTKPAGMFFLTPEIGYLLNGDGTLFITKDSCATWTSQTIDLSNEKMISSSMPSAAINFQDEEHGMIIYAAKSYQLFCIKTEDGGSSWEPVEMPQVSGIAPYISRDGKYLTVSSSLKKIGLYKFED